MTKSDYHLAFHYCNGIGPKTFLLISKVFNSLEKAWLARQKEWLELGFSKKLVAKLFIHKNEFDLEKTKQELAKLNIKYLAQSDANFPKYLKQIHSCPIGLFFKGSILPTDQKALAVVGSRKVTNYGREVTQKFVSALSLRGFTIISGMARGVDGISHRTALDNGGRTIAIFGSGLDKIYPPEHKNLSTEIIKNGALISEYPPGTEAIPGNFPARNRIVSGLSLGVLVTEGSQKSGTNITAMMAVEQNREVFAIPGPITSQMSQGPAKLIQLGAKLVMSVDDIMSELNFANVTISNSGNGKPKINSRPEFDDQNQEQIWQFLINGNQHIDDIVRSCKIPISQATTTLTMMELKGMVKHLGEGNYMVI
jgi:DNA processing protein